MKDAPSAPPPLDPARQITAQANATPSVYTPFGSRVYSGDPNQAGSYRMTETLSPEQQKAYEGKMSIVNAMLGAGTRGLDSSFKFSGADDPRASFFFQNQKKLLDEAFGDHERGLDQKLANQGLPMGGEAYDDEMGKFRDSREDAYSRAAADSLDRAFNMDVGARQQNYNEIAAALGGAQLTPISQGGAIDVSGAYGLLDQGLNRQYEADKARYAGEVAMTNAALGAGAKAYGAGGA
jgi:hypothetical protein